MKFYSICFECSDLEPNNYVYSIGEVEADLIALCVCPYGHKIVMRIGYNLCDILYSSAVLAFVKDCLSESVMSFAASLERAYEMFTKVTLHKENISYDVIELYWKDLSKQSERQYGAFCTQFLKSFGEPWKTNQKMVEFRNKVIHKGYIASTKEVTEYAEYITESVYKILKHLHANYDNESTMHYFHEAKKNQDKIKELMTKHKAKVGGASTISLLNWNIMDMPEMKFSEAVEKMRKLQRI
ncbi:MAG: hypothetical protein O9282_10180 [Flavobacterium sp.]|jgi:hypothetical protein|uniref:hypothetical protein n=1 Tax=Flavobacterium sp. TaxID=239 RepID=UPI0022C43FAD|nr:hypothetical protein [Flavobacterium sp.]MCZ8090941.1 hypothetical protein [Flavobacterium sp.]MCZ8331667.1 hypothetical protein [Flavobacterium sp.]